MEVTFRDTMAFVGLALDGLGVLLVTLGALLAIVHAMTRWGLPLPNRYRLLRENLGRAILLGLEVLIAGDIIRSVVVDPTVINVAVLGLIVLIRTFLSMTLQLEVEGRWPWQQAEGTPALHSSPPRA
jgi:uncharacterized membrane protein